MPWQICTQFIVQIFSTLWLKYRSVLKFASKDEAKSNKDINTKWKESDEKKTERNIMQREYKSLFRLYHFIVLLYTWMKRIFCWVSIVFVAAYWISVFKFHTCDENVGTNEPGTAVKMLPKRKVCWIDRKCLFMNWFSFIDCGDCSFEHRERNLGRWCC